MKFTINLSLAEYKGLQAYIKEVGYENPTKKAVQSEVESIVTGYINSPGVAISDYIKQVEKVIN